MQSSLVHRFTMPVLMVPCVQFWTACSIPVQICLCTSLEQQLLYAAGVVIPLLSTDLTSISLSIICPLPHPNIGTESTVAFLEKQCKTKKECKSCAPLQKILHG